MALADADAGFVHESGELEDTLGGKAAKALHREARDREHPVSGVDRLRHAPDAPDRRPVVARRILIFDVVVDQGEVVKQLDRRGRRQRAPRVAGQRFVHERAEHRPEPLSRRASLRIQAEVVQHHPVEGLK